MRTGVMLFSVFTTLILALTSCGKSSSNHPTPDDFFPADNNDNNDNSQDAEPKAVKIGEFYSVEGDVLKDENNLYSLTKVYSFKLDKTRKLQVRKGYSNGNCGPSTGSFVVLKGEEQLLNVTIDPNKDYQGNLVEKFPKDLAKGSYYLVAFITLEKECKNQMYYYEFKLEDAK